ncbi:MAG: hypothetical protein H9W82_12480 [Lactobacillus sp.]|nr:hypothetical protein [Lactobacillus sp.]
MADITILEASKILGYSKNAVKYQVRKLPVELTTKDANGVIYIKPQGLELLRAVMVDKQPVTTDKTTSKETTSFTGDNQLYKALLQTVETLTKQLDEKDRQIKSANEEKEKLLQLLDQQQRLSATQIVANKELPEKVNDSKGLFKFFQRLKNE